MQGHEKNRHQVAFGFCTEDKVPLEHPIRGIKIFVDKVLHEQRHELADMYSDRGRPSIPPQTLLKSMLLMALFSVRSERMFCEMVHYNLLFQWFLNQGVMDSVFDASTFSKNRDRLLEHDVARKFFEAVNSHIRAAGLFGSEHFSVDGSLIAAWASMKSLKERDKDDFDQRTRGKDASAIGKNDKLVSSTDPEASIASKPRVSAHLAYSGNVLMENESGLCVDIEVLSATGSAEREAAEQMLTRQLENGVRIKTVGADANYHRLEFVKTCRNNDVIPHVAPQGNRKFTGLDGRTWSSIGYLKSQRRRKGIERIFGWLKFIGGWRHTRLRGRKAVSFSSIMQVTALNIMRSIKLAPSLASY